MAELTWGTPLFFDLWAAGMAGGAYFAAFLLHLLGLDRERRLLKLATYIGVPLVLLGVILIIADLGEPLRAFNMYLGLKPQIWELVPGMGAAAVRLWPPMLVLRLLSPMSLGGWVLVLFTAIGIVLIVLWIAEAIQASQGSLSVEMRALGDDLYRRGIGYLLDAFVEQHLAVAGAVRALGDMHRHRGLDHHDTAPAGTRGRDDHRPPTQGVHGVAHPSSRDSCRDYHA